MTRPLVAAAAALILLTGAVTGQAQAPASAPVIPRDATALEGTPRVKIDATREGAVREVLDAAEAAKNRLTIKIADGRFYWAGQGDQPLSVTSAGGYTYLSSTEPGRYMRFTWLNNTLAYVEHVDTPLGSVTYWGELRVVLGGR
jgi:hypothetical protein